MYLLGIVLSFQGIDYYFAMESNLKPVLKSSWENSFRLQALDIILHSSWFFPLGQHCALWLFGYPPSIHKQ